MAESNGKITGSVSVPDVRSALGEGSTDTGGLCTSSKINWRAKYKPMDRSVVGLLTESQRSANPNPYGVVKASSALLTDIMNDNYPAWGCKLPTGGASSPYRLADFRCTDNVNLGYNHYAVAPLKVEWPLDLEFDNSSTEDRKAFILLGGYGVPGWELGTCLNLTDLFTDIENANATTKYYLSIIMLGVVNGANRWWAISSDIINSTAAAGNGNHLWTIMAYLNRSVTDFPYTSGTEIKCVACLTTQSWGSGADPNLASYAYPLSLNGADEATRTYTYKLVAKSYISITLQLRFTFTGTIDGDYITYQVTGVDAKVSSVDTTHGWTPTSLSVNVIVQGSTARTGATLSLSSTAWQSLGTTTTMDENRYLRCLKGSPHGFGVNIAYNGTYLAGAGYSAPSGASSNVSETLVTGDSNTVRVNKPTV